MKTEPNGASGAENHASGGLEDRLAKRFDASLAQAARDYPDVLARASGAKAGDPRRAGGIWPRLAAPVVTFAVVALVAVIGLGLVYRPATPAGPSGPDASASPTIGLAGDGVPTTFNGERVYRAADQAQFGNIAGSFLLGGVVTTPDVVPPCPMWLGRSDAETKLIPYCTWVAIDGLRLAPGGDSIALPSPGTVAVAPTFGPDLSGYKNRIVVARVHVHDGLAASCPVTVLADCRSAVVAEAVVWVGDPVSANSTPGTSLANPSGPLPSISAGVYQPSGSPGAVSLGPDGTPVSIDGRTVYRASNVPADKLFLLGGVLQRDTACTPPTALSIKPPACGYRSIGGLAVGTLVNLPEASIGDYVVAEVERVTTNAVCPNGPCRNTDNLVVRSIVWAGGATIQPPLPPHQSPANSPVVQFAP